MSIATDIANALGAPLLFLAKELGCQVARYTPTTTRTADKQSTRTYSADLAAAALPAFFEPGRTPTEALQKPFGVRTTSHGTLLFVKQDAIPLPIISPFDGFKITTGPYAGYTWIAEAEGVPDDVGATMSVVVIAAPAGAIT